MPRLELDPSALAVAERYMLLIGGIVPRPIAFVSTLSPDGRQNLAPYSFFTGVGSDPMSLLFCPANDDRGGEKDTLRNCKPVEEGGLGEFVVNASTEGLALEVAAAGEPLPYGESEFGLVGLTPAPSSVVRPPRVLESPLAYECRTIAVVRLNPGVAAGGNVVIGRVVHVSVDEALVDERLRIDPDRLGAIARMGGATYSRTRERFDLPRGVEALRRRPTPDQARGAAAPE